MSCLNTPPACRTNFPCPDILNCVAGVTPDFSIKQHSTRPPFKVPVVDDEGNPMDLTGLIAEFSMWTNANLKNPVTNIQTDLKFVDDRGFWQILVGDIIIACQPRDPEHMIVTGFDNDTKIVYVERGVNGTTAQSYKRGASLKLMREINAPAETEMVYEDETTTEGNVICDVLTASFLVYYLTAKDTCLPGCYCADFNLLKLNPSLITTPSIVNFCELGVGVEWQKRIPFCGNYLIKICENPTPAG
jgi:hypothetical protein